MAYLDWLRAHPIAVTIVAYLLSGVFNALFKPRTPEAYAELPRWRQAFCKFAAATGLDPVKLVEMMVTALNLPAPGDGSHVVSKASLPPTINIVQHFAPGADPQAIAKAFADDLAKKNPGDGRG